MPPPPPYEPDSVQQLETTDAMAVALYDYQVSKGNVIVVTNIGHDVWETKLDETRIFDVNKSAHFRPTLTPPCPWRRGTGSWCWRRMTMAGQWFGGSWTVWRALCQLLI